MKSAEFAKTPLGVLLADWGDDHDAWQGTEQTVYEVVSADSGDVVTRHWSRFQATEAVQEMIDRDGCEVGEYFIRPRRCTLAPLRKKRRAG